MEKQIIIYPDIKVLYYTSKNDSYYSSYRAEISIEADDFGPRFKFAMPGLTEWQIRYEAAAFFQKDTAADFDWRTWHYEGLLFAKAIWQQLPRCYTLYYTPPFEDKSNTIDSLQIDEHVDDVINQLASQGEIIKMPLAYQNNIDINIYKTPKGLRVTLRACGEECYFSVPPEEYDNLRQWLNKIANTEPEEEYVYPLHATHWKTMLFFPQQAGLHPEMGVLWGWNDSELDSDFFMLTLTGQTLYMNSNATYARPRRKFWTRKPALRF